MKEFLGIYGYEEDVDINMEDSSAEGSRNETSRAVESPTCQAGSLASTRAASEPHEENVSPGKVTIAILSRRSVRKALFERDQLRPLVIIKANEFQGT